MIFNLTAGSGKAKIAYSGTCTTESYTADGQAYTLYKITGSGTLTVRGRAKNVDIWLCGGGANGNSDGGGGAYCAQYNAQTLSGSYTFAVGAATGASSVTQNGATIYTANGATNKNGGTGGGGTSSYSAGKGDGLSKYPFGDTSLYCHCAGGGAGEGEYCTGKEDDYSYIVSTYSGYDGGSNGGDGSKYNQNRAGGNRGGGNGGNKAAGSAATFYGSGGGGGGCSYSSDYSSYEGYKNTFYPNGAGYQGIVYLRVPA